jgi:hypothetical protein
MHSGGVNKTDTASAAQNDTFNFTPLFGSDELKLQTTPKAVTPFAGMASFFGWLGALEFQKRVAAVMPFEYRSPNAIAPEQTLTAFISAVIVGASRFAHAGWLRHDKAFHALLGVKRFPGEDAIRRFFHRFTQPHIEVFWRPLWRWMLELIEAPKAGFSLDLDSTVFSREGAQEGAAEGYNPRRPGRKSHHPILAVLAEMPFVLHAWMRSGNTGSSRGVVEFLKEALALLPKGMGIRCVRADSGFFDQKLLRFLEEIGVSYIVVAKLSRQMKLKLCGIGDWVAVEGGNYEVSSLRVKLGGWDVERRFVVLRERIREEKEAVGRRLLDVPGYTYRVWVTNRTESALEIWRDYNGRATVEQRIEEMKNDLNADGFCTKKFFATEAAFLGVVLSFNLLSLYQAGVTRESGYRKPSTLRTAVFVGGAILGRKGRDVVLRFSESWGGLKKHIPLIKEALNAGDPIAPLLPKPPGEREILDALACGGCAI